jgi:pyrroline-5-carboxylate reductase
MIITLIGGGNMASALIAGLLKHGVRATDIKVVEIRAESRERLRDAYGVEVREFPDERALECEVLLLAVKPQQIREVAGKLAGRLHNQLVLSIAAGVRAGDIERWLGGYGRIVRAMPNTPALVGAGAAGLFAGPGLTSEDRALAEAVLNAVGFSLWLEEESALDAVTAVSGSGPAYVYYFMEAMEQAARELGLPPGAGSRLVLQTFLGAARLAQESGEDPATLRHRVTSPGGTTERAISVLDERQVRTHIVEAVRAAALRAKELADVMGKDA